MQRIDASVDPCGSPRSTSGATPSTSSSPRCRPTATFLPLVQEKEMLRLGDVVSREGEITPEAADAAVAHRPPVPAARRGRGRDRDPRLRHRARSARAANGDEVVDRIEAEAGVDRRRDQRARGGPTDLRSDARRGAHRPRRPPSASTSAAAALEIMVGDSTGLTWRDERTARRGPAHRRVRALRSALEGRPAAPARNTSSTSSRRSRSTSPATNRR